MLADYFSPLAPAVVLLLGAFILAIVFPRLPASWQAKGGLQYFSAPILIGLAVLALLATRLTFGQDVSGEGLELLSGWNLSTAESAAALTVRVDVLSLAFLSLTLLILFSITLAAPALAPAPDGQAQGRGAAGWLAMGAGACLLFVSANGLTIGYAVLIFDLVTTFYWLWRGAAGLGVARLFLGLFTAGGLALATVGGAPGILLLSLALWLRLGLYPFIEATVHARWNDYGRLVYLALSLAVGFYLAIRVLAEPLPELVCWLVLATMLLNGLLTWLTDQRPSLLTRLALTIALPVLLVGTLAEGIAVAYAIGLILSLGALWVTPGLGKPKLTERAWPWPYLPAVGATLTLVGLPFSLGWPARIAIYQSLIFSENIALILVLVLAEGLALSGLLRYWRMLWSGAERDARRSVAGTVMMTPFLVPGLAPFILAIITRPELAVAGFEQPPGVFVAIGITIIGAAGLGYFRTQIIKRLKISPPLLVELVRLRWLLYWLEASLNRAGKAILRLRVFLEGQHYIGWALFTALVGVLIILLGT